MRSSAALHASRSLVLAAALAAAPARAEDPPPAAPPVAAPADAESGPASAAGRVLNGHVFMPAADVPGPLLTTSFLSGLLVGVGNTSATLQAGSQVFSGHFQYAGIGAVLGYEYAFLDYFSARVSITELIYSGITGRSAVVVGSRLQGGATAGVTFSMPIGDQLRAGVLFDAGYTPDAGLTIGTAIKSVVDSCEAGACDVTPGNAFELKNVATLKPALAVSWAPHPALGVTGNVAYSWASQTINGKTNTGQAFTAGLALDYDFRAISPVPVGLQAQFSWAAPSGSTFQHVTDLGGGIFYTGRKNLALGLQLVARRFAVTPDVNVTWSTYIANIGLRYYW